MTPAVARTDPLIDLAPNGRPSGGRRRRPRWAVGHLSHNYVASDCQLAAALSIRRSRRRCLFRARVDHNEGDILMRTIGPIAVALAMLVMVNTAATSQTAPSELRVATRVLPPVVVDQGGTLTGFSIDLWSKIAERMKLKMRYQIAPDVRALLDDVRTGKADLGVAAISVTAARETEFDFSHPILNAGLQIMVRGKGQEADSNPLMDLLGLLFSKTILVWLGIALLLIIVPAHLVWFLERNHRGGIVPTEKYIPGIFHAMDWAAGTLATQAEQMPRQWLARVVSVHWTFT